MPKDKNIGIVGGAGYLGSHLAKALSQRNRVRVVDIKSPDYLDISPNLSFVSCDVTQAPDCERALRGLDIVFHRAGLYGNLPSMRSPHLYYQINVLGTMNVLQACASHKVERLVFDSTEFVYGHSASSPVTEQAIAQPSSIYGATKLICEAAVRMYDSSFGLSSIILRFCRVRDKTKNDVISTLADRILKGDALTLFDRGAPCMDFIEITDVTRACELAADSKIRNEIFNIGPGEGISLNQIVETIRGAAGAREGEMVFRNASTKPPTAEYQFGPEKFYMSIAKADALLGWRPAIGIRQSVKGTVEFRSSAASMRT